MPLSLRRCLIATALAVTFVHSQLAHAQRDLSNIPKPDTSAEQDLMRLGEESAVNLFASDPQITKPIQINFDSTGALWVASSEVYPQIRPGEIADDKIIVLRDTDDDGIADKRTVFADGLLIPTGVLPDGPNAAYVAESTRILYLEDTDGDGKSDSRRVVFSGFGTEDTHHLVHTLRWGPDGCVYFNQSIYIHTSIETAYGTRRLDAGGIWRYRPSTGKLEVLCEGFINPWGHVFNPDGESFVTDGAYFQGINYAFPDSVFVTAAGATRWLQGMNPGSPKHCGLEILSGGHVPEQWQGDLVTNDFRSHRVCRFTVQPSGSAFISRQQPEIMTTAHVAFRPIDARMGPDGAVYVADWYNPIIQHGEVDFRDDRRDREHGRVWRISFPGRPLETLPNFSESSTDELLTLLEQDALWVRQFARQELWNRAAETPDELTAALTRWHAGTNSTDQTTTRLRETMWLGEVLERSVVPNATELVQDAINAKHPAARTLLRSLWRSRKASGNASNIESFVLQQTTAKDPRVRLEAIVCAGQMTETESDQKSAVQRLVPAAAMPVDDTLDFALWQSLRNLSTAYQVTDDSRSLLSTIDWQGHSTALAYAVGAVASPEAAGVAVDQLKSASKLTDAEMSELITAIAATGNATQLGSVLTAILAETDSSTAAANLQLLIDRTTKDKTIPAGAVNKLTSAIAQPNFWDAGEQWSQSAARAVAAWKVVSAEPDLVKALQSSSAALTPELLTAIAAIPTNTARETINRLAKSPERRLRTAALTALVGSRPHSAIQPLVDQFHSGTSDDQSIEQIVSLMKRKDIPEKIARQFDGQSIAADTARLLLRRVRSAGGNAVLENSIRSAGALEDVSWKLTPELSVRLQSAVASTGNAVRGESIYRRMALQCTNCHGIGPGGSVIGPNLISLGGSSQVDYIIESLLAPSAKLKEGFSTRKILTDDGRVISGIQIGKTASTVRLRNAEGNEVDIETDAIESESAGQSLMPAGLVDTLTEPELVDLIAFMSALGRTPEFTVSTEPTIRGFEMMVYSNEANRRLNRTSTDTAASGDPAMKWIPVTSLVSGEIAVGELDQFKQHRTTPLTSFIRFTLTVPEKSSGGIEVPIKGIDAWIDGKPTPVWKLANESLSGGTHTIVLALDRTVVTESIKITATGDAIPNQIATP